MKVKSLINQVVRVARRDGWDYRQTAQFIAEVRRRLGIRPVKHRRLPVMPNQAEWNRFCEKAHDVRTFFTTKTRSEIDVLKALQKAAFIHLLEVTGLRVSEAANLKRCNLDLDQRIIIVRNGKGGKDRIVPITVKVADELADIMGRVKTDWIFENPDEGKPYTTRFWERQIERLRKIAQVETKITPHTFRHQFLTRMAAINPAYAQILAGHSRADTTMLYTHLNIQEIQKHYDQIFN